MNRSVPVYHSVRNTKQNFEFSDPIDGNVFEIDPLPKPKFKKRNEEKKEILSSP